MMERRAAGVRCALAVVPAMVGLLWAASAEAHGVWAHIHVTAWAIENLPDGELKDFYSDPEVFNAALYGAAFTDSGYWPQAGDLSRRSRAYGEHTHWEPFIQDFVAWIITNDPPPWNTQESRKRVAFLMGCASHGMQDEIFDSLFLYQVREHDGGEQEEADPGIDGFFAKDGWIRHVPSEYIPMDTLLELYSGLSEDVDEPTIRQAVGLLNFVYLGHPEAAAGLATRYEPLIPWAREHYLDPDVPGSLVTEVNPTMRYQQAIWERLHGRLSAEEQVVIAAFPESPRRLRSAEAGTVDGWATFIFGVGMRYSEVQPTWVDDADSPVPFQRNNTRWGGTWPRLIRLQPSEPLTPGAWYTVGLPAGVERIDGLRTETDYGLRFQVACDEATAGACEELGELPGPDIGEPHPPGEDAGPDAEADAVLDAEPDIDPGIDAEVDTSTDAAADVPEPVEADANHDADVPDTSGAVEPRADDVGGDGGCGCGVPVGRQIVWPGLALALLVCGMVMWRRRP